MTMPYHDVDGGRTWAPTASISDALRGHVAYSRPDAWSLGASYERIEARTGGRQDFLYAAGRLNMGPRLLLAAAIGYVEEADAVQPISGTAYHVGVLYTLIPSSHTWRWG